MMKFKITYDPECHQYHQFENQRAIVVFGCYMELIVIIQNCNKNSHKKHFEK